MAVMYITHGILTHKISRLKMFTQVTQWQTTADTADWQRYLPNT